ncbi:MAG: SMC-Scp complex subunit ScpB [Candidatus Omnitrophica bacterium]|nr:SMC-Scp complex subunit ScpB [Candidatus Omnitrophota bacterium]
MMENSNSYLKSAVEAILFVNEKPVMLEQLQEALETVDAATVRGLVQELQKEYEANQRGMIIVEVAGGYQMVSNSLFTSYLYNFFKKKVKERLSRAALETLALVAYKQPVSRADIEMVRGVNSDGVVTHLLERELIKVVGRKEVAGRPFLYGTTRQFLEYFGLKSLKDLPRLEDVPIPQDPLPVATEGDAVEAPSETGSTQEPVESTGEFSQGADEYSEVEGIAPSESRLEAVLENPPESTPEVRDLKQVMEEMDQDEP